MSKGITMPPGDLRKLQLIELEMLLEVDRICRENNIQYFLSSGTALGAVRHKGFIPWDDDLDIRMMREEYEKFCKVCETQLDTSKFFLQNDRTDKEYRWGYGKIRRKGTEYLRAGQEAIKCFSGVSVDIFVIDNVPDTLFFRYLHHIVRRACIKTLWSVIGVSEDSNPLKRFLYRGLRHVNKRIPLGIMEHMVSVLNKKKRKYICCTAFFREDNFNKNKKKLVKEMPKAEWFEECVEIEFEGFLFYICKEYDKYLSNKYGDYWSLPPDEKRTLHPPKSYFLDVDIDLRGRDISEYMKRKQFT